MPKPWVAFFLVFLLPQTTNGQDPRGPQFQINSYTTASQEKPTVALSPEGSFVVVWSSPGSFGTDTFFTSIQGQRYLSTGSALGSEFQINTYTSSTQERPVVAVKNNGDFVVTWDSDGSTGDDPGVSVQAQRFASDGTMLGLQFQINSYTTSSQLNPDIVISPANDFLLVWESQGSPGDPSGMSIQGRRFASDGSPQGTEFQVNTYTTNFQRYPSVAMAGDGSFVVAWASNGSNATDNSTYSVQGQRFTSLGQPIDSEFQVNTTISLAQKDASIAMVPNYDFVVVWSSFGSGGSDNSLYSIQGQRYSSDGLTIGFEFQVNTYTTLDQRNPTVVTNAKGEFVVTWQSYGSSGTDSLANSLQTQRFDAEGEKIGGEFQVNSYTTSDQFYPTLTLTLDQGFLIAWQSDGSNGSDSSSESIQGQLFRWLLFRDGFESGDTSAWSASSL